MTTILSRRTPLSEVVVTDVAAEILAGDLAAGAFVPPEPQLCARFGVSRTVVREAMARLQKTGLVRIRQGSGTVVLAPSQWHEFDPDLVQIRASTRQIADLMPDLLVIRRMIEVDVAGYTAVHRTNRHLERLAALIDAMNLAGNDAAGQTELDVAFHEELIAARGNRLLVEMMRPINRLRRIGSLITTSANDEIIARSIADHIEIFRTVEAGDEAAARAAMERHLIQFEDDLRRAMTANVTPRGRTSGVR